MLAIASQMSRRCSRRHPDKIGIVPVPPAYQAQADSAVTATSPCEGGCAGLAPIPTFGNILSDLSQASSSCGFCSPDKSGLFPARLAQKTQNARLRPEKIGIAHDTRTQYALARTVRNSICLAKSFGSHQVGLSFRMLKSFSAWSR